MNDPTFHLEGIVRTRDEMQDFSGPLSLILMLLAKNKIEIRDLKISDILDQYLEYIAGMQKLDLDIASEFVQMASHLVYIKTRTLLAGEEEVGELEELLMSLEQLRCQDAYAGIKAVTGELLIASMQGLLLFSKEPEPTALIGSAAYEYSHTTPELFMALASVLVRGGKYTPTSSDIVMPKRIIFSVREKSRQLINLLRSGRVSTLKELYALSTSRSEVVATFICVLELCASGNLLISERDGEMSLNFIENGDVPIEEAISEWESLTNE